MMTRTLAAALGACLGLLAAPSWAGGPKLTVYKSPTCGCCSKWIEHLEAHGFEVKSENRQDMNLVKAQNGVPRQMASCHTAIVEGYVIEGHVPAEDIERLLKERPDVAGISVPGMPVGAPGMEGPNPQEFAVISFEEDGDLAVFSTHTP